MKTSPLRQKAFNLLMGKYGMEIIYFDPIIHYPSIEKYGNPFEDTKDIKVTSNHIFLNFIFKILLLFQNKGVWQIIFRK